MIPTDRTVARYLGVILFVIAAVALSAPAQAQVEVKVGLKEGGHFGTFAGKDRLLAVAPDIERADVGRRPGFVIGGFTIVEPPGPVAIQTEALWIWKGAQVSANNTTTTTKLNYVEVPVLARYQIPASVGPVHAHVLGGPTFGFSTLAEREQQETSGRRTTLTGRTNLDRSARNVDLGMALGVEVGYDFSQEATFVLDVRYQQSFTSALNRPADATAAPRTPDASNRGMAVTLGWIYSPGWTVSFD